MWVLPHTNSKQMKPGIREAATAIESIIYTQNWVKNNYKGKLVFLDKKWAHTN